MAWALACAGLLAATAPARGLGSAAGDLAAQGRRQYERGQYEEALRLYREAMLRDPKAPQLHFNAGDALFRMQEYDGAAQEYGAALAAEDPALRARALYNLGNVRFQQQRLDQAVQAYQQALEFDARDLDAKANLELALQRQQQRQGGSQGEDSQQQNQQGQRNQQQDQQQGPQQNPEDRQQQQPQPQEGELSRTSDARPEGAGAGRRMSREDAERLLQALKDRELAGKLRRTPAATRPPEKDW